MNSTEKCPECGCQDFRTAHDGTLRCEDCDYIIDESNYEPPEPDGEAFRGGEAEAFNAEQQAKIQRELK